MELQAFGDTTKAINGGDNSKVIGSFGLGVTYRSDKYVVHMVQTDIVVMLKKDRAALPGRLGAPRDPAIDEGRPTYYDICVAAHYVSNTFVGIERSQLQRHSAIFVRKNHTSW